jgi:hypothetical protein
MTTGRINQVAILNPRCPGRTSLGGGPEEPPERATRKGSEDPGSGPAALRAASSGCRAHPNAPTEFSKTWSAGGGRRAFGGLATPQHTRLRRRVPVPGGALGQLSVRVSPRRSGGAVAIGQPSTDPMKKVACWPPGGSRASVPLQGRPPEPP